jgi:hypothetical protein
LGKLYILIVTSRTRSQYSVIKYMDTYDLQIYKGQTFSLSLTLRDTNGTPLNLAGQLISGYLKTKYSDSGVLTNLNVTIADAANGIVTLGIAATGTAVLPVNYAFYDVELLNPIDQSVNKVLGGKALIYPEVTF